mmetsp:Transcript_97682/g.146402  ORF Transcript_97682/g.146402 Transcript_97682/m.146402 type:complete len:377 (-) Transcript_97682:929-2059(-)
MERDSNDDRDVPYVPDGSLQRGFETANEAAMTRFALQQRLLQANAADVLGDLQQRQQAAAQQQQQQQQLQQLQQQQRLGAIHQQQLIQQHLQQQQQSPARLTHSLTSLLGHSSGLGLPANQLGISGLPPFGRSNFATEARLLAPNLNPMANNLTRPSISNLDALQRTELIRSALLGATGSSLSASARGAGMQASTMSQLHHQSAEAVMKPPSVGSVLDQYCAKGAKEPPFPLKLHQILSNPEYQDCICWLPHGKAWRILKPSAFEQVVIPHFFRHAKYASFMRQVNGWGFKRMVQGVEHNSYYHELFVRERPELCLKMKRTGNNGKPQTKMLPEEQDSRGSGLGVEGNIRKQTEMTGDGSRGNGLNLNPSTRLNKM